MKLPLTVSDFLDRAELVYGRRIGVVDEPDQPAESWGELTYARFAELARAQAAGLDRLGIGQGERVAMVTQNAARLLSAFWGVSGYGRILVPVNFRLNAEEVGYIVEHSGASVLLVDPELDDALRDVKAEHRYVIGADTDAELLLEGVEPVPWREPDEDATATINYTSGTTARPKGVELTHRNVWINATTFGWQSGVSDRDVYLHTLPMFHCNGWGMTYAVTGMGGTHIVLRKVDGTEILRRVERHGVTLMCGAPAVANAVLDAAAKLGRTDSRQRPRAHRRRRRAAADAHDRTHRVGARVGVRSDLRPHRDVALAHDEPPPRRVRRPRRDHSRATARSRRCARARCARPRRRGRRGAGAQQRGVRGLLGATRRHRRRDRRRLVPHRRRRRARRRRLRVDLRPQEGRDHQRWGERVVDRGGGRAVLAPGRCRSGRHRRARRKVG